MFKNTNGPILNFTRPEIYFLKRSFISNFNELKRIYKPFSYQKVSNTKTCFLLFEYPNSIPYPNTLAFNNLAQTLTITSTKKFYFSFSNPYHRFKKKFYFSLRYDSIEWYEYILKNGRNFGLGLQEIFSYISILSL